MATKRAEVLTGWVAYSHPALGTVNAPEVTREYALANYTDITGQPNVIPNPNVVSVLITCDETTLTQIAQDVRFFVLWEEYA